MPLHPLMQNILEAHGVGAACAAKGSASGENASARESSEGGGVELYSYSLNEEDYRGEYASREEAAAAAFEDDPDCPGCWTGRIESIPLHRMLPDAGTIIERMQEAAYDAVHDHDWLDDVTSEQEAELEAAIHHLVEQWLAKHNNYPRFWSVEATLEHLRPTAPSQESAAASTSPPSPSQGA